MGGSRCAAEWPAGAGWRSPRRRAARDRPAVRAAAARRSTDGLPALPDGARDSSPEASCCWSLGVDFSSNRACGIVMSAKLETMEVRPPGIEHTRAGGMPVSAGALPVNGLHSFCNQRAAISSRRRAFRRNRLPASRRNRDSRTAVAAAERSAVEAAERSAVAAAERSAVEVRLRNYEWGRGRGSPASEPSGLPHRNCGRASRATGSSAPGQYGWVRRNYE